ncbi:hypothetical protein A3F66_04575 [candidate division TM6 bacterium RIFCSPHIGHO2_12_FULL_32_22]|nr:MAG: hypothetical protein A3F66_04575 [candidate division TM6 bacterium RIFCSPHIGHO2_12_FULL_32_22]
MKKLLVLLSVSSIYSAEKHLDMLVQMEPKLIAMGSDKRQVRFQTVNLILDEMVTDDPFRMEIFLNTENQNFRILRELFVEQEPKRSEMLNSMLDDPKSQLNNWFSQFGSGESYARRAVSWLGSWLPGRTKPAPDNIDDSAAGPAE